MRMLWRAVHTLMYRIHPAQASRARLCSSTPRSTSPSCMSETRATPRMRLASSDPQPAVIGAVLGYPGGGPEQVSPAAVKGTESARSQDIFSNNDVVRTIEVLAAKIVPVTPEALSSTKAAMSSALSSQRARPTSIPRGMRWRRRKSSPTFPLVPGKRAPSVLRDA